MAVEPVKLRYKYKTTPFSHQKKALNRIYKLGGVAGLFMEMGTGKTKVAIDWASLCHINRLPGKPRVRRVLVLCPISVMSVWKAQIRLHSPVKARIAMLEGTVDRKITVVKWMTAHPPQEGIDWVVLNYESVWRHSSKTDESMEETLRRWKPDLIIADESHKIKSAMSKQSRACFRLAQSVPMRIALTGTPITKSPLDVFGQFRFIDGSVFGTRWTDFKRTYGEWGGFGGFRLRRYKNLNILIQRVRDHSYRIKKEQCLDLPPRVGAAVDGEEPNLIPVELSERGKQIYIKMAKEMIAEIEEMEDKYTVSAEIVLTKILRLSQITSGFVKDTEGRIVEIDSAKLDVAMDLIEDMVEQSEKVVVFCRFIHDIESLQKRLDAAGIGHCVLRGGIKGSQREATIARFRDDPETSVFVSQIASGSLGIDLTAASLCIFFSWDYRWENYRQAVDRLHRQGQTRHCTYYHLVVPKSIDTESLHILSEKGNLAEAIVHNPNILRPGFLR